MQELKEDIRAIRADVSEIKTTMAVNTESLKAHMARTAISERRLEKLEYVLIGLLVTVVGACLIKWLIG